MTTEFYRGFEIVATKAHQVKNTDEWTVDVHIRVHKGAQIIDQQCHGPNKTYLSEEEAIKAGLFFGERSSTAKYKFQQTTVR